MAYMVPGVGTFDPDLPDWLVFHNGRLYNINALNNRGTLTEPWVPPEGWRGDGSTFFTPEWQPTPEPDPAPVPAPGGAVGPSPVLMHRLLGAMRAVVAHDNEMLALARQRMDDDTVRMQESLRLSAEANQAFEAVLADLQSKVNPQ